MGTILPFTSHRPTTPAHAAARLHQMATESYDRLLLGTGSPHPDMELLALASTTLSAHQEMKEIDKRVRDMRTHADYQRLNDESKARAVLVSRALVRAGKLRAVTPAGTYAKCLMARAGRTVPVTLLQSVCDDLIENAALRNSIWPAADLMAAD